MTEVFFKDTEGNFPVFELFDQVQEFSGFAVGRFLEDGGGTGFVVRVDREILIVTAAHIFIQNFRYDPSPKMFLIGNHVYLAKPKKSCINWKNPNNFLSDPISQAPLSFPEDWTLCTLIKLPGVSYAKNLIPLKMLKDSISLNVGSPVKIVGFPSSISNHNIKYCIPSATIEEASRLISDGKLSRSQLKVFTGKVLAADDVICADCCSLNGMSGGPLLIQENGSYFVVGLLHGSRPSLLHSLTGCIINEISNQKIVELIQILEEIFWRISSFKIRKMLDTCMKTCNKFLVGLTSEYKVINVLDSLYDHTAYIEEKLGNHFQYNTFISSRLIFS